MEHWQTFRDSQLSGSSPPVDDIAVERRLRKEGGVCSLKSLMCCIGVLFGMPSIRSSGRRRRKGEEQIIQNIDSDDASFGYNFDDDVSPLVWTRLPVGGRDLD